MDGKTWKDIKSVERNKINKTADGKRNKATDENK